MGWWTADSLVLGFGWGVWDRWYMGMELLKWGFRNGWRWRWGKEIAGG